MTEETPWAGTFCKDADKEVLVDLENEACCFQHQNMNTLILIAGDVTHLLFITQEILGLLR